MSDKKEKHLHIRISQTDIDKLEKVAEYMDRSKSDAVVRLIKDAYDNLPEKNN